MPSSTPSASSEESPQREVWREAVTMALYLSLSLLAVILATSPEAPESGSGLAGTILLTALGLLVAHILAFAVSSRLVSRGQLDEESRRTMSAQVGAGLVVAVGAALPVLVLGPDAGLTATELLLLGFVCAVGYLAARQAGVSKARALLYSGVVLGLAVVVLLVKSLVGH
jgi:hypothetical protein